MFTNDKVTIEYKEIHGCSGKFIVYSALLIGAGMYIGKCIDECKKEMANKDKKISELKDRNSELTDELEKYIYEK